MQVRILYTYRTLVFLPSPQVLNKLTLGAGRGVTIYVCIGFPVTEHVGLSWHSE